MFTGFTPNCTDGTWTEFFDQDNPSGNGDFELLRDLVSSQLQQTFICRNPTSIDVRLLNGSDYRVGNQNVRIAVNFGFECRNDNQNDSRNCLDYMVRFCCPDFLS